MSLPFRLPPKPATIVFADGSDYQGLELEVDLRCSMDLLMRIGDTGTLSPEQVMELLEEWATGKLLGWNLVDADGAPVPATAAGLRAHLDFYGAGVLLGRYYRAVNGVDANLGARSRSGGTSATQKPRRNRRSSSARS